MTVLLLIAMAVLLAAALEPAHRRARREGRRPGDYRPIDREWTMSRRDLWG